MANRKRTYDGPILSHAEKKHASILVVDSEVNDRGQLKTQLRELGFAQVADAPSHITGLERFDDRKFTHVLFEAKDSSISSSEFLRKVLSFAPECTCIPSSYQPDVDNVFDLIIQGARGYLCKPFTALSLEESLALATKGDPICDIVRQAKDRNEALIGMIMTALDSTATTIQQAATIPLAQREIPMAWNKLFSSVNLGKAFARGGADGLMDTMMTFCMERSKGPASRLGRLRRRLKTDRVPSGTNPLFSHLDNEKK
jgi:DNA-binding NarL/FixJ family response regulator